MSGVTKIRAISLWQPWAYWIAWGWKTVETRTHDRFASLEGERIAIHAAQTWDTRGIDAARDYLTSDQIQRTVLAARAFDAGMIICTARVQRYGVVEPNDARRALIECETPRFGLWLTDVEQVLPKVRVRGRQGIFVVELTMSEAR